MIIYTPEIYRLEPENCPPENIEPRQALNFFGMQAAVSSGIIKLPIWGESNNANVW